MGLSLFLDVSLLVIIVVTVLSCWFKGFIRSTFGLAKSILCVFASCLFGPMASAWVSEHLITARVTGYVHGKLLSMFEAGTETFDLTQVFDNLPSWLNSLFNGMGVDPSVLAGDLANQTEADAGGLSQLASTLAQPITKLLSDLIAYAGIFLITMLFFSIIASVLIKISKLPVIHQVDRVLGLVLGIVCALIYTAVYTLLVYAVMSLVEAGFEGVPFHEAFENSWLFRHCFNLNILRWIFGIGR